MLSVTEQYESINRRTHTDQQKQIKFYTLRVRRKCRWIN